MAQSIGTKFMSVESLPSPAMVRCGQLHRFVLIVCFCTGTTVGSATNKLSQSNPAVAEAVPTLDTQPPGLFSNTSALLFNPSTGEILNLTYMQSGRNFLDTSAEHNRDGSLVKLQFAAHQPSTGYSESCFLYSSNFKDISVTHVNLRSPLNPASEVHSWISNSTKDVHNNSTSGIQIAFRDNAIPCKSGEAALDVEIIATVAVVGNFFKFYLHVHVLTSRWALRTSTYPGLYHTARLQSGIYK